MKLMGERSRRLDDSYIHVHVDREGSVSINNLRNPALELKSALRDTLADWRNSRDSTFHNNNKERSVDSSESCYTIPLHRSGEVHPIGVNLSGGSEKECLFGESKAKFRNVVSTRSVRRSHLRDSSVRVSNNKGTGDEEMKRKVLHALKKHMYNCKFTKIQSEKAVEHYMNRLIGKSFTMLVRNRQMQMVVDHLYQSIYRRTWRQWRVFVGIKILRRKCLKSQNHQLLSFYFNVLFHHVAQNLIFRRLRISNQIRRHQKSLEETFGAWKLFFTVQYHKKRLLNYAYTFWKLRRCRQFWRSFRKMVARKRYSRMYTKQALCLYASTHMSKFIRSWRRCILLKKRERFRVESYSAFHDSRRLSIAFQQLQLCHKTSCSNRSKLLGALELWQSNTTRGSFKQLVMGVFLSKQLTKCGFIGDKQQKKRAFGCIRENAVTQMVIRDNVGLQLYRTKMLRQAMLQWANACVQKLRRNQMAVGILQHYFCWRVEIRVFSILKLNVKLNRMEQRRRISSMDRYMCIWKQLVIRRKQLRHLEITFMTRKQSQDIRSCFLRLQQRSFCARRNTSAGMFFVTGLIRRYFVLWVEHLFLRIRRRRNLYVADSHLRISRLRAGVDSFVQNFVGEMNFRISERTMRSKLLQKVIGLWRFVIMMELLENRARRFHCEFMKKISLRRFRLWLINHRNNKETSLRGNKSFIAKQASRGIVDLKYNATAKKNMKSGSACWRHKNIPVALKILRMNAKRRKTPVVLALTNKNHLKNAIESLKHNASLCKQFSDALRKAKLYRYYNSARDAIQVLRMNCVSMQMLRKDINEYKEHRDEIATQKSFMKLFSYSKNRLAQKKNLRALDLHRQRVSKQNCIEKLFQNASKKIDFRFKEERFMYGNTRRKFFVSWLKTRKILRLERVQETRQMRKLFLKWRRFSLFQILVRSKVQRLVQIRSHYYLFQGFHYWRCCLCLDDLLLGADTFRNDALLRWSFLHWRDAAILEKLSLAFDVVASLHWRKSILRKSMVGWKGSILEMRYEIASIKYANETLLKRIITSWNREILNGNVQRAHEVIAVLAWRKKKLRNMFDSWRCSFISTL